MDFLNILSDYIIPIVSVIVTLIGGAAMWFFKLWFNSKVDKKIKDANKELKNEINETTNIRFGTLEEDMAEVKIFMHHDQKFKIDLSETLGEIKNHMASSKA